MKKMKAFDELTLEPLEACDLPPLKALVCQVWSIGFNALREAQYQRQLGEPWQDKIWRSVCDYRSTPHVNALKATLKGEFVGFIFYRIDLENRLGEIGYNAVDPQFRGHGIGKKLLGAALHAIKEAGIEHVEVITGLDDGHAAARRLYEGAGFKPMRSMIRYTLETASLPEVHH